MTSLLLGTELSAEQRDYAETVRSSADNLLDLLNDVLDLSKVEAGRLELEVLDFDLFQLVRDVTYLLKINAEEKGIALTAAIDDDVRLAVRGDPGRLRQVLLNLVGNAVKFTGHGSVHLRVMSDQPPSPDVVAGDRLNLRFEVIDTGIGIAPEVCGRLFESFSQADASTTRRFGGTGLGLAISRSLVSMFEGEIGVESELGVGSTFWFTARLLAGALSPAPPRLDEATVVQPSATPSLVLVVDDNATNQKIAVRMLEALGHRADVAADGVEAVSAWANVPYDLILMDCQMPLMDGYEAARTIRAAEAAGRRTPIVAMTASAMAEDRERCLDAGMDDFLSKPVQLSDIRDAMNRWLNRSPETAATTAPAPIRSAGIEGHVPVLDEVIIAELRSYGRDFLVPLVEEFMTTVPERLVSIRAAVGDGDPERLARAAHALRGGTATMGAARVAQACAQIEEAGVRGDLATAARSMPALEVEISRLLTAVSSLLDVTV
jgi:CheY-like chemotaxis protein/HPt (histidine-containing phosphotransfer) domain-containing protein